MNLEVSRQKMLVLAVWQCQLQESKAKVVTVVSPFSLAIQLNQMKQFKAKVDQLHSSPGDLCIRWERFFGAESCTNRLLSTFLVELPHNASDIDLFGCLISYNNAVVDYSTMLDEALEQTRREIADADFVYTDIHSVMLELSHHPTSHGNLNSRKHLSLSLMLGNWAGMKYGTKACCGYGGGAYNFDKRVYCRNKKLINGRTLVAWACSDPYSYVSWDGIHATEAANKIVAHAILNGSILGPLET